MPSLTIARGEGLPDALEGDDARGLRVYDADGTPLGHYGWADRDTAIALATATLAAERTNRATLLARARTALATNATYLSIPTPTQGQALAQVAALTRQSSAVIRVLIGALDSLDGT